MVTDKTSNIKSEKLEIKKHVPVWLLPLTAALFYPFFIDHFTRAVASFREFGNFLFAGWAALLMFLAMAVPFLAIRALIRDIPSNNSTLTKSFLYLIFSISPLYTLTVLLAWKSGIGPSHGAVWAYSWILFAVFLHFTKDKELLAPSEADTTWLRLVHGGSALILLTNFLILHVANHATALWSVNLHVAVMEELRLWYRLDWVESALFALLLVMILTGAPMVLHYARRKVDAYRTVQISTGIYIALFLSAHLLAVLSTRGAGKETDWFFATGPDGLLDGASMLIPYYAYSVFFFIIHVACGLRIVLLKHNVAEVTANKTVHFFAWAAAIITTAITTASLGFHFQE